MFSRSAEFYDRIYRRFKDYEDESRRIHALLERLHGSARTLLDVACGTGEHARILHQLFDYQVDGIDLDEKIIALARKKNPEGRFVRADMVDFDLGKTYDVVMCLFSSIAYVRTLERVTKVLGRLKAHAHAGGLIVVEPWFRPGGLAPGKIFVNTVEDGDLKIARMGYTKVHARLSTIHFEYLVGAPGKITHEVEEHQLGLFTVKEMKNCFLENGLEVDYDPEGLSGKGLYVARHSTIP